MLSESESTAGLAEIRRLLKFQIGETRRIQELLRYSIEENLLARKHGWRGANLHPAGQLS
jgi:hypothetical protein